MGVPENDPKHVPGVRLAAKPKLDTKPLRGIRVLRPRHGRPNPYGLTWSVAGESGQEWFPSTEKLEGKVKELNAAKKQGTIGDIPTRAETQAWRVFMRGLPAGVTPQDVLAGYNTWKTASAAGGSDLTVGQACTDFLALQEARLGKGKIGADTMRQKRVKLTRLGERFALTRMDALTAEEFEEWLDDEMTKIVRSPVTWNDYRRKMRELYSHYVRTEVLTKNLADKVERRDDRGSHIRVTPVPSMARLLKFARDHRPWMLPRLALEVFMGLRFTSAARIEQHSIKLTQRGVDLPADIVKTKTDHYVDSMPPVLWEWVKLGWNEPDAWDMSPIDYMHAKSALFADAQVTHRHNTIRHTFCSYHIAAFTNPGLTATIMLHRDQEMIWERYKGKASKPDGVRFFKLSPSNVGRFAGPPESAEHPPTPARTSQPRERE